MGSAFEVVRNAGALVTPTGRLILNWSAAQQSWNAEERCGMTASDVSTIMCSPNYEASVDVYARKCAGVVQRHSGLHHDWQPAIGGERCSVWARDRAVSMRRLGLLAHRDRSWMLASIDQLVGDCSLGGQCAVEFKTCQIAGLEHQCDGIPYAILVQSMWQLAVSGLHHLHLAVLTQGEGCENYTVFPDAPVIEHLIAVAGPLWQCVVDRIPPIVPIAQVSGEDFCHM